MRKIKILEHISIDGIVEQGEDYAYGNWTDPYRSPAGMSMVMEAQGTTFDLLLGRTTYDLWAGYWPHATNPSADGINSATKYIATHRPKSLEWGPFESLGDDIVEGVRKVKATEGPDLILWGSSTMTALLLENDMVDEVILIVYPVLLGKGKRLFDDKAYARELSFVSSQPTQTGLLLNTYKYVGKLKS